MIACRARMMIDVLMGTSRIILNHRIRLMQIQAFERGWKYQERPVPDNGRKKEHDSLNYLPQSLLFCSAAIARTCGLLFLSFSLSLPFALCYFTRANATMSENSDFINTYSERRIAFLTLIIL